MKYKSLLRLSIGTLLLIAIVQGVGVGIAYDSLRKEIKLSLDESFKKAFEGVVDGQVNNLPYPDGTVTHFLYYPVDSTHTVVLDNKSFYLSQQSSAILQDYYGLPEISLDSLKLRLEKELRYDGVEGHIAIQKVEMTTGKILQEVSTAEDKGWSVLGVTSCQAWLHEPKGIAVQARLDLLFTEGPVGAWVLFCLLTLLLSAWVIGVLYASIRRLRAQEISLEGQRQNFYQQAKEVEKPVEWMAAGINAKKWMKLSEVAGLLLASVEDSLTRAKQEHALFQQRRLLSLSGLSAVGLASTLTLVCLWGVYLYRNHLREVAHRTQICIEEAFAYENIIRSRLSARASGKRDFQEYYLNGTHTEQAEKQWSDLIPVLYKEVTDSTGKKQYAPRQHALVSFAFVRHGGWNSDENARLYMAYTQQQLMEEFGEAFIPVDSVRMDSLFNVQLWKKNLPVGHLNFYREREDSLSSNWTEIITRPLRIREDCSEWMQGVMPISFWGLVCLEWYFFLPLVIVLLFTFFCIFVQWIIGRKQKRLGQFREDFTYSMIHDMKSPLQSILMGSQIMASGRLPEGSEKAVRICAAMADECDHLLTLSNRVVTLTQMERGELELHKTAVVLRPLLDDLSGKFRLKAPKPVAFEVDCPSDFRVMADAFCLREVLSNLIDNAIKYSREEVSIRLSAESGADGGVVIRVRDNGIGIPPREQQRIFGKFERVASGSRATGASGFGLGLNFVWQVVRAHGGRVEVRSDGHSFSEFAVVLPG